MNTNWLHTRHDSVWLDAVLDDAAIFFVIEIGFDAQKL
jgi:hypothetical protein